MIRPVPDNTAGKALLHGKHCRGPGCDDFNEQNPGCHCDCYACEDVDPHGLDRVVLAARMLVRAYREDTKALRAYEDSLIAAVYRLDGGK